MVVSPSEAPVLSCADLSRDSLRILLERYGLRLEWVAADCEIPGSYWGEREAGLVGHCLYVRDDTPVHSALHEAGHYVCMDEQRRARLHTDAGGELIEEDSVCYLQILLAQELTDVGQVRMCADMDAWGYSFRLGSARAWFEQDADDARRWLQAHGLLDADQRPVWHVRQG